MQKVLVPLVPVFGVRLPSERLCNGTLNYENRTDNSSDLDIYLPKIPQEVAHSAVVAHVDFEVGDVCKMYGEIPLLKRIVMCLLVK